MEEVLIQTDTTWLTNEIMEEIKNRQTNQEHHGMQPPLPQMVDNHHYIREAEYIHLSIERTRKTSQVVKTGGLFSHIASHLKSLDAMLEHSVVSHVKSQNPGTVPQQTQRSVRSPLMRRRINGISKTTTKSKTKEPINETVADVEDTSKVIDNELVGIRQKLVVFYQATLFYRWMRGCIDTLRTEKQAVVTTIIRWYRGCIIQRHLRRLQRVAKKLLRFRLFIRICQKRAAIQITKQFLQDLQDAKYWKSMQAYLQKVRLCQRVAKTFLRVSAARRQLYHLLANKIESELRMEAIHGRGRGGTTSNDQRMGDNTHGDRYHGQQRMTSKQREDFEYPAVATERVVSRKIHNRWQEVKLLVENYATRTKNVEKRNVKICEEMSSWLSKRNHNGCDTSNVTDADGVLEDTNTNISKSISQKLDTSKVVVDKIDNHHPQNVAVKGWKLRDNTIRKSMAQKRHKHVQNVMDARRLAATRAAVLDIEHAKQMLFGPTPSIPSTSVPIKSVSTKVSVGKRISQGVQSKSIPTISTSLFLCLTDPSLGMTWTLILRNVIKRELRHPGD